MGESNQRLMDSSEDDLPPAFTGGGGVGRPMDSSEDDTDPFEAAREAEYLAELELEASVTDSWVAQSNSDEALDNSLQLLAMLQDNTAAVQLPSRADTAGHDPFLDEDDYDIRTDQQPAPTPAPTQLPRLPSGDKCLLRLWELADTARLAECAADRRIDQYLHSPIAAAGPKRTVELQMLSNRRLVRWFATPVGVCEAVSLVVEHQGQL